MRITWFLAVMMVFAACKGKENAGDKAYQQTKQSLADKEKNNPEGFLKISGYERKKNLLGLGKQTVVKAKVSNTASVCSYKDVRVKMLCFDKDGKRVEEHEDILDDVIKPGESADFRARYKLPRETDSIALSIMSATAVGATAKK